MTIYQPFPEFSLHPYEKDNPYKKKRASHCETRPDVLSETGNSLLLRILVLILKEIVVEIIIEIVLEILQIVRCEETVYTIRNGGHRCHNPNDGQNPENTGFLLLLFLFSVEEPSP